MSVGAIPTTVAVPLLRQAFDTLTFESQFTPKITIEDPFGPTPPSAIGSVVRPRVVLSGQLGEQVIEPWGTPATWVFPFTLTAVALGLIGIGYALGQRSRPRRRRRS